MSTANLLCDNAGNRWSDRGVTWHSCMTAGLPTGPTCTGHVGDSQRTQIHKKASHRYNLHANTCLKIGNTKLYLLNITSPSFTVLKGSCRMPSPLHYLPNQESKGHIEKLYFLVPLIVWYIGMRLLNILSVVLLWKLEWWIIHFIHMLLFQVLFHVLCYCSKALWWALLRFNFVLEFCLWQWRW